MEDREKIMQQWDMYRQLIADGNTSSLPRDWFESIIDRIFEPEDNWQPIETAPKDGCEVILFYPHYLDRGFATAGYYYAGSSHTGGVPGFWYSDHVNSGASPPTHWQHLPSPPEGET